METRAISVTMPQRQRSAVTNGKRLFVKRPGDTAFARRFRDILAEIISDIGGHDAGLSEGQRQLARRCATLSLACERMEGEAAAGKAIDVDLYGQMTDRLGRAFHRLGLKRQNIKTVPTLSDYLRERTINDDAVDVEAAE